VAALSGGKDGFGHIWGAGCAAESYVTAVQMPGLTGPVHCSRRSGRCYLPSYCVCHFIYERLQAWLMTPTTLACNPSSSNSSNSSSGMLRRRLSICRFSATSIWRWVLVY
jgi:hypothetical protein